MKRTIILIAIPIIVGMAIGYTFTSKVTATNICTNNNTRDLKYEAYCDSIWNANPDYYLDVITETDEYQLYIEEHGSWWSNNN